MRRESRRLLIRDVVARRRRCGEPLTVRAIQAETGGSNSTILDELARAETAEPCLEGDSDLVAARSARERELVARIKDRDIQVSRLTAELEGLRAALRNINPGELQALMTRADDTYRMLMVEVDRLRHSGPAANRDQQESVAPAPIRDAAATDHTRQVQALIQENVRLSERVRDLEYQIEYGEPRRPAGGNT